nr:immunoglobulin heavy chain junction region [Mus musculus]
CAREDSNHFDYW